MAEVSIAAAVLAFAVLFGLSTITLAFNPLEMPVNDDRTSVLSFPNPVSDVYPVVSSSPEQEEAEELDADEVTHSRPAMTSTDSLELMPLLAEDTEELVADEITHSQPAMTSTDSLAAEAEEVAAVASLLVPEVNPVTHDPSDSVNSGEDPLVQRTFTSLPLTVDTLRPTSRRFSKFPCHHRRQERNSFKEGPRENIEIQYGNDMLVASSDENSDFQDLESLHAVSAPRVKLNHFHLHHCRHHEHDSESDDDDRMMKKLKKRKMHFHRERMEAEKHLKRTKGGFFRRVGKFLDHYF